MTHGPVKHASFEEAVETIHRIVIGICNCHHIDPDVRDDIAQEILLRVYRSWEKIENLHAYVAAATRYRISTHFHRLERERKMAHESAIITPEQSSSPRAPTHLLLEQAFQHVSSRDRRLIILYYICGHTLKEIALQQRLSITTVWNRLRGAMRALRGS